MQNNQKKTILEEIKTNPRIRNYISSENLEAFTQLNEKDKLDCIKAATKNQFAIVQLAAAIEKPELQKETLKLIESGVNDNYAKREATQAIINNTSDQEVLKQAMYTTFNIVDNEQGFKAMFNMKLPQTLESVKIFNQQIKGDEQIKGKNEGLEINQEDLSKAYKSMESVGRPLNDEKKSKLEQNTEFKSTFEKLFNAIKEFLGISVKSEIRKDLKESIEGIGASLSITDNPKKSEEKKSFTEAIQNEKKDQTKGPNL